jgi:hypothetical protein
MPVSVAGFRVRVFCRAKEPSVALRVIVSEAFTAKVVTFTFAAFAPCGIVRVVGSDALAEELERLTVVPPVAAAPSR